MTREEKRNFELIVKICERAEKMGIYYGERINHIMDIEKANERFNMDLERWLNADDINFVHDYMGIYANIDRSNGTFNLFLPRFARC